MAASAPSTQPAAIISRWHWPSLLNGADFYTACGLILARICAAHIQFKRGIWLASGGHLPAVLRRHPVGPVAAIALGRVILAGDRNKLRTHLRHEVTHTEQFLRSGIFFPALYAIEMLDLKLRGKDPYHDNCFEKQACSRAQQKRPPVS